MGWPPKAGEALPQVAEALGVREKLSDYSLNVTHEDGGPKARGFERILGITIVASGSRGERNENGRRLAG